MKNIFCQLSPSTGNHRMPRSVIATGFVDYVLPPEQIAHKLEELAGGPPPRARENRQ